MKELRFLNKSSIWDKIIRHTLIVRIEHDGWLREKIFPVIKK
jgi:hypothetical protein